VRYLSFDLHVGVRLQGSRRHYCIHKVVSKEPSVDEACEKLMQDDGGCRHAQRATLLSNKSERLKARCCNTRCHCLHHHAHLHIALSPTLY
jgi:hypothetical protein